jgi:hypothetical protein
MRRGRSRRGGSLFLDEHARRRHRGFGRACNRLSAERRLFTPFRHSGRRRPNRPSRDWAGRLLVGRARAMNPRTLDRGHVCAPDNCGGRGRSLARRPVGGAKSQIGEVGLSRGRSRNVICRSGEAQVNGYRYRCRAEEGRVVTVKLALGEKHGRRAQDTRCGR